MKSLTLLILLLMPLSLLAQSGVHFEQGSSWAQVQEKAKTEHKYIFLDCYATWCGPCKLMDLNVYPSDSVGTYFNQHFISVKLQGDSTGKDDAQVRAWYANSRKILKQYHVEVYPTFLFFSPDGKLVTKAQGYQQAPDLIKLAAYVQGNTQIYETRIANFKAGKLAYAAMPDLAVLADQLGDNTIADRIRQSYLQNYLYHLDDATLFTKDNLFFIAFNMQSTKEKGFPLFFDQGARVDRVIGQNGFSLKVVRNIIRMEAVNPVLATSMESHLAPNWDKLSETIKAQFGKSYVDYQLLDARVEWYRAEQDWPNYVSCRIKQAERDSVPVGKGFVGMFNSNNTAWDLFQHASRKQDLEKALKWSAYCVEQDTKDGEHLDTKANLLYKLGKTQEALEDEARAVRLAPFDPVLKANYEKMKKNEPTW